MGLSVFDRFARSNGALGTAPSGQAWSVVTGAAAIASEKAKPTYVSGGQEVLAIIEAGSPKAEVYSRWTMASTGINAGLIVAYADASNFLFFNFYKSGGTNGWTIYKEDTAVQTALASDATPPSLTLGGTYDIALRFDGVTMRTYLDGVSVLDYTLTAPEQAKYGAAGYSKAGVMWFVASAWDNPGSSVDDFRVLTTQGRYGMIY